MVCLKFVKQSKGQALIEAALVVPLIIIFLFAVLWFVRIMLT
jgi:Flp pilus assembly protein TadG